MELNIYGTIALVFEALFVYPLLLVISFGYNVEIIYYIFILNLLAPFYFLQNSRPLGQVNKHILVHNQWFAKFLILVLFVITLIKIAELGSIDELIIQASLNSKARYDGSFSVTLQYRISSILLIFISVLLPLLKDADKTQNNLIYVLIWLFILTYDSILHAARAFFMMNLIIYFATVMSLDITLRNRLKLTPRKIIQVVILIAAIVCFAVIIQFSRSGQFDWSRLSEIIEHTSVWIFGHIPAFSSFLATSPEVIFFKSQLGQSHLRGLYGMLGIGERLQGVYFATPIGNDRISNIYSILRNLVEDFSIFLAFFILPMVSVVISRVRITKIKLVLCILLMSYVLWGFVNSIFVYNNILVGLFLSSLYITTSTSITRR